MAKGKNGYDILMESLMEKMGRAEKNIDLVPDAHKQDVIDSIQLFYTVKEFTDKLQKQMLESDKRNIVLNKCLDSLITIMSLSLGEFSNGPTYLMEFSDNLFQMVTGVPADVAVNTIKRAMEMTDSRPVIDIREYTKPDGKLH